MERLLLLWDELDEFVGWGRYIAAGWAGGLARRRERLARRLKAASTATQA